MNEYLREITSDEFTARDFRTWAGTVLASAMLREFEALESEAQARGMWWRQSRRWRRDWDAFCLQEVLCISGRAGVLYEGTVEEWEKRRAEEVGDDASSALREEETALIQSLRRWLKSAG